jgi:hypothetical protein
MLEYAFELDGVALGEHIRRRGNVMDSGPVELSHGSRARLIVRGAAMLGVNAAEEYGE